MKKENNHLFQVIIFFKAVFGVGTAIAGSYLMMGYVSKVILQRISAEIFKTITKVFLIEKLATFALVSVGRLNMLGLGITIAEIFLRKFFFDNALEKWCKQCAFRSKKNNSETPFKDMMAESKAFEAAIHSNLG